MNKSEVFSLLELEGVKTSRLSFTCIRGRVKDFLISPKESERAIQEGIKFNGSSKREWGHYHTYVTDYEIDSPVVKNLDF